MSGSYATPLRLELRPSRRLEAVLAFGHGLALLLLPFYVTGTGAGLLLAGLLYCSWRRARHGCSALPSRARVRGLCWGRDDRVDVLRGNGEAIALRLQPDACVTAWLVVLRLRDDDGRLHHLPVLPDMLPREQFRRLCVRLRLDVPALADSRR